MSIIIPTAYEPGYEKASLYNKDDADLYMKHVSIGDPQLDPVMQELADLEPHKLHRHIKAGIDLDEAALKKAPQVMRDFFNDLTEPEWLDYSEFNPGRRAFFRNSNLVLMAFIAGVLIEGFTTMISKSFYITGRVDSTTRRLSQNTRHLMEIMVPGGLERFGDGWKLSARIRIVHSRIRHLLDGSDEWDTEAWGVPLSAAHLGYAITVFSQRLLVHSNTLGAPFNKEEWDSFLKLWRYTGYVMGIPESILYKNEEESLRIQKITHMLEPEIGHESIVMANQLIENAVLMSGADADVREETRRTAHKLSRCLIGNEMADALGLPKTRTFAVLPYFRATEFSRRLFSNSLAKFNNFSRLMNLSVYDNIGITYELPDHVKHKHSGQW